MLTSIYHIWFSVIYIGEYISTYVDDIYVDIVNIVISSQTVIIF